MGVLLGVLVALGYGSGDFLGGLAAQRSGAASVVLLAQLTGAVGIVPVMLVLGTAPPAGADLLRGAAAGAVGVVGLGLLYRGLATARVAVVAPVAAVVGAVVPLARGVLAGERPSGAAIGGITLALLAVALVSAAGAPPGDDRPGGAPLGALAGALLGGSLVLFAATSHTSGLWPVAAARLAAVGLVVAALASRRGLRLPRTGDRVPAVGAGALDVTANALLQLALRAGLLTVVAPVAALAPGATVLVARLVQGERLGRQRAAGLVLALAGLALLAGG